MRQSPLYSRVLLITIGWLSGDLLYSQSQTDAALYIIWSDTSKTDDVRLEASVKGVDNYIRNGPTPGDDAKWVKASPTAVEMALRLGKKEYLPLLYLASAINYIGYENDTPCGCEEVNKAFESGKMTNAPIYVKFMAYLFLDENCSTPVNDETILTEFSKIKDTLSDDKTDLKFLRDLTTNLASHYFIKNQYPTALKHALESQGLCENLGLIDMAYAQNNQLLTIIHSDIGNYQEAERYGHKSLSVARMIKDTSSIGSAYIALASVMLKAQDEIRAKHYIDSAIYIMRDVRQCDPCFNYAKIVDAGIKNLSGHYTEALAELSEVETYLKEQNIELHEADLFIAKANAYLGLKRYDEAIEVINASKELKQSFFKMASNKYSILVKAYEAKGDFEKALEYYKRFVESEDSLTVLRNRSEVSRLALENQYAQQQLKSELEFQAQLNQQKATKNLLIILGVGVFLVAIGLLYRLKYIRKTQKILEQKNEIIEAEKVKAQASERAKHQFLANMSHEIRTPMNAIKGMTDILIRRNPKDEQKEYLESIRQSSDSLLVIINDILDISKIEAGKVELEREPYSVADLVNTVHTIMQFKAEEKGLELRKDIGVDHLTVLGDASRLRQILINLIGNAIKFTDKGVVTTSVHSEESGNTHVLHFVVSDTGVGIDKDRFDKIFKSFEQAYSDTSRKYGGTGLGLSISKKLVELHHGEIWVTSEKGKGSQFHFTIPYEVAETGFSESTTPSSESNIAGELKGIRVLLVEDNQFNAVVAQEELEDAIEGVKVELAENGAIAVEKLRSGDYDVILMDVQMPKMNGYEATQAIRTLTNTKANIPIIAMTANVLKEEVDLCFQAGMNDFIGKPFDTPELLQKIYNLKIKTND